MGQASNSCHDDLPSVNQLTLLENPGGKRPPSMLQPMNADFIKVDLDKTNGATNNVHASSLVTLIRVNCMLTVGLERTVSTKQDRGTISWLAYQDLKCLLILNIMFLSWEIQ